MCKFKQGKLCSFNDSCGLCVEECEIVGVRDCERCKCARKKIDYANYTRVPLNIDDVDEFAIYLMEELTDQFLPDFYFSDDDILRIIEKYKKEKSNGR